MASNKNETFSAEEFIENLRSEGTKVLVTNTRCFGKDELPPYYNEELFKKAQVFYRKHLMAIIMSQVCALVTLLSDPISTKLLEVTKRTSEPKTAYRRYVETIFHFDIWFRDDFRPGSKLWKSIKSVKMQHKSASKQACNSGLAGISHYEMVISEFSLMGYVLIRPEEIGIHNASDEELEAFVHFWRVIGYTLGIEDRFNLCRESLKETKDVCEEMLNAVIKPMLILKDPVCLKLQFAAVEAMNMVVPNLSTKAWYNFIYKLMRVPDNNENGVYFKLPMSERFILRNYIYFLNLLKYKLVRMFFNQVMRLGLWLTEFYPILARFKIGKKYSDVKILETKGQVDGDVVSVK